MRNRAREHFENRADKLADCAVIHVAGTESWPVLKLVPTNPASLGVDLTDLGDGTCGLDFDTEYATQEFETSDPADVDYFLNAAIEGRVRILTGPGRGSIQIDHGNGYQTMDTHYSSLPLFPRFGWRRRAAIRQYGPYRSK
jgi:hypothetical protein